MKFKRSMNIVLKPKQSITVPSDEIWKVTAYGTMLTVNGVICFDNTTPVKGSEMLFAAGTTIHNDNSGSDSKYNNSITGIAFSVD